MERKRVIASNIRSVGYDGGKQLLEIEFTSGSIVQYSGVSPEGHRPFVNAPPRRRRPPSFLPVPAREVRLPVLRFARARIDPVYTLREPPGRLMVLGQA